MSPAIIPRPFQEPLANERADPDGGLRYASLPPLCPAAIADGMVAVVFAGRDLPAGAGLRCRAVPQRLRGAVTWCGLGFVYFAMCRVLWRFVLLPRFGKA